MGKGYFRELTGLFSFLNNDCIAEVKRLNRTVASQISYYVNAWPREPLCEFPEINQFRN